MPIIEDMPVIEHIPIIEHMPEWFVSPQLSSHRECTQESAGFSLKPIIPTSLKSFRFVRPIIQDTNSKSF